MNVLIDSCVWAGARKTIEDAGHDVASVNDWDNDPGDDEILHAALEQSRIIITLDKDFGTLAIRDGKSHCGILRLARVPARKLGAVAVAALAKHGPELQRGAIVTADELRVRVRAPEA